MSIQFLVIFILFNNFVFLICKFFSFGGFNVHKNVLLLLFYSFVFNYNTFYSSFASFTNFKNKFFLFDRF